MDEIERSSLAYGPIVVFIRLLCYNNDDDGTLREQRLEGSRTR